MFIRLLALVLLLLVPSVALAQNTTPTEIVVASSETPPLFADNGFDDERLTTLLSEAAKQSDLSPFRKNRVDRILKGTGPFAKLQKKVMLDRARAELAAQDMIDVAEDGKLIAAVDWNSILKLLIEQVLPILLKLLIP